MNGYIADIKMQGNTRLQLVLQAHEIATGMPIILVTGYPSLESAVAAVRLPVSVYLVKPLDFDEFLPLVEQCVARGRLFRLVASVRDRVKNWSEELDRITDLLGGQSKVQLIEPANALLGGTFESLVKSIEEMGTALSILHASEHVMPPSERSLFESRTRTVKAALLEAVGVLEQSKHVFKSKRLGELRKQFQEILDDFDGPKKQFALAKS